MDDELTMITSGPVYEAMALRGLIRVDPMEKAKLLREAEEVNRARLNGAPSAKSSWGERRNFLMGRG
jgi:hypothetical protein